MSELRADPALAARLGTVLRNRHSRFAVATVADGNVSVATVSVPLDAADDLRPLSLTGSGRFGRPKHPWTGKALAPAGGIRASIGDMGRLTRARLDGSAPGTPALDPVADFAGPAARIRAARITTEAKGRSVTWHNGAKGFSSWLGLDRDANTGVVLMSATSASVDRHGFRLLTELTSTLKGTS